MWIVDSGILVSETFLIQSLENLKQIFDVTAVSGGRKTNNGVSGVHYTSFARKRITLWHTIFRKITGVDLIAQTKQRRARSFIQNQQRIHPINVAWIHFGTTAVLVYKELKTQRIPYFIQVHGVDVTSHFSLKSYKESFIEAANGSNGVICSSAHIRKLCVLAGVQPAKVTVVKNALNVDEVLEIKEKKTAFPSFVHFGRLTEKKHPVATLLAFKLVLEKHPNARLTFIGDGPVRQELEARIQKEGVKDQVNLLGAMNRMEALPIVANHWVFCQHSVTSSQGDQEGFANSLAEAALLGLPVVSTWHNGIPENVMNGETGFLVHEFDFEGMAERMLELANSLELREKFGQQGRNRIVGLCNPEERVESLRDLLNRRLPGTLI